MNDRRSTTPVVERRSFKVKGESHHGGVESIDPGLKRAFSQTGLSGKTSTYLFAISRTMYSILRPRGQVEAGMDK
jgi:hypothetical protein